MVFKRRVQLDAAVDISDVVNTYSLSMVLRFGRKRSPQERATEALEEARARILEEADQSVSDEKEASGGG